MTKLLLLLEYPTTEIVEALVEEFDYSPAEADTLVTELKAASQR